MENEISVNSTTMPFNNKAVWWAYLVAPAVAPILFAIAFFVFGVIGLSLRGADDTGTPAGVVMIPLLSLTVGMFASYAVAGIVGMPIAFFLRRRGRLNALTIHGAALVWSLFLSTCIGLAVFFQSPTPTFVAGWLLPSALVALTLSPFILLSATTFWWIGSRDKRRLSLSFLLLLTALVAGLAALFVRR